jgi:plasmid stabilization system protein ParE
VNHPLIVRPEAEEDMEEGRNWYDGQRDGLGVEFLVAVEKVFNQIQETPELYAAEYKSVRRVRVKRFPYVIYYRLVDVTVEVLAVQHGSRRPGHWRKRA